MGRKPESSVCPVRRSRRLKPQPGPWADVHRDEPMVPAEPQGLCLALAPEAYDVEGEPGSPTQMRTVAKTSRPPLRGPQIPALESPL